MEILREEQSDNIILPSNELLNKSIPINEKIDITTEITKKQISNHLIPEGIEIESPNYLFDYSQCDGISIFEKHMLKGLACNNGEGSIAIYIKTKNNLVRIGYARENIDYLIDSIKNYCTDKLAKIYKDVKYGENISEVKERDITTIKLRL